MNELQPRRNADLESRYSARVDETIDHLGKGFDSRSPEGDL